MAQTPAAPEKQASSGSSSRLALHTAAASAGIFLSRIGGLLREMAFGFFFGASPVFDAFVVAFRIPSSLRQIVAEGAFTVALLPHLKDAEAQGADVAARFRAVVLLRWTSFTLLVSVLLALGMPWLVAFFAPGMVADQPIYALAIDAGRMMAVFVMLVSLYGYTMALAQARHRFFWVSVAPLGLNLALISAVGIAWMQDCTPAQGVMVLAGAVVAGAIVQLLVSLVGIRGTAFQFTGRGTEGYRFWQVLRTGLPALGGTAVYQLQVVVLTALASSLGGGVIASLFYMDRLVQLPLALIGTAMGTVSLPVLAEKASAGPAGAASTVETASVLDDALALAWLLAILACMGLFLMAEWGVQLVYGRGAFDAAAVQQVSQLLRIGALMLPAAITVRILNSVYHSRKDMRTPVWISTCGLVVVALAGWALSRTMGPVGLVLALVGAAWVQVAMSMWLVGRGGMWRHVKALKDLWRLVLVAAFITSFAWLLGLQELPGWQGAGAACMLCVAFLVPVWFAGGRYGRQGVLQALMRRVRRRV